VAKSARWNVSQKYPRASESRGALISLTSGIAQQPVASAFPCRRCAESSRRRHERAGKFQATNPLPSLSLAKFQGGTDDGGPAKISFIEKIELNSSSLVE
jgi:hypothetical protein